MLIGILGLGMLMAAITAAAALFAGQSLLMAFGLYVSVGVIASLMIALAVYMKSELTRTERKIPESDEFQQSRQSS